MRLANTTGESRALVTLLDKIAASENGTYAAWQFTALASLLDALEQGNSSLAKLAAGDDKVKASVGQLAGLFDSARQAVADTKAPIDKRREAVRVLGRGFDHQQEDLQTLAGLLVPQAAEELQAAAIATLGRLRGNAAADALIRGWKGYSPGLRSQVLDLLLGRPAWTSAALDAVEHKQILPFEIDAAHRQLLLQQRSSTVRERAAKLLAGATDPDRQKVIDSYRSVLTLTGDPQRGAQAFAKTCAACHQFKGVGHQVGPELASVGDKSPEGLLIAILDPNRAVKTRYINYVAQTKNGQTFTGILTSETGNSITLLGQEGKQQVILRNDLEELASSNKSLMPEGLEKDLKPQDLADLIAHIRAGLPQLVRKSFAGNNPEVIKPGYDGALHLAANQSAIYGSTLVYEMQYGNLGYWSSDDDHAEWTLEVTQPGKYAVRLDWACDNASAGNSLIVQAGLERLTVKVQGTGNWDTYKQSAVGQITLAAGKQQLVVRPAGRIHGALIDLRSIKLTPSR